MPCFIFGFATANLVGEGCHMLDAAAVAPPFIRKECTLCNGNAFTLGVLNMPSICQVLLCFSILLMRTDSMTFLSLSRLTAEKHGFPGMDLELSAPVSNILFPRMRGSHVASVAQSSTNNGLHVLLPSHPLCLFQRTFTMWLPV